MAPNIKLVPMNQIAHALGHKVLCYSGPGVGKTPVMLSAPNAMALVTEPGVKSVRNSTMPTFEAFNNPKAIRDWWEWVKGSNEVRKFETLCIDSASELAECLLRDWLTKKKDGRAAYGEMAEEVYNILAGLFFLRGPNVFLTAKQDDKPDDGTGRQRPYFPGKELHIKVPHLYDMIFHLETIVLNDGTKAKAFRTADNPNCVARDRSGMLNEFEPADLAYIFRKADGKG